VRNANQVTVTQGAVTDTLRGVTTLAFAGQKVAVDTIPCFAAGTRVLTARGEVPIEALRIGDRLPTVSGGRVARVAWLGHQRSTVAPVRVDPETLGEGMPHRPLILSPDHAVYVNGVLIPVQCLVNAATVGTAPMHSIDCWHVELDRHAAIVAGGLACESYLDTGNRHLLAPPSVPAKDAARRRG